MKKVLLIDSNSFVYRSFHALPPLTSPLGEPAGALYGLINTMLKILSNESPDYVSAAIDSPEKTFRKEMFEGYKAHRPKAPDDLKAQLKKIDDVFESLNITTIKKPGFEADDILATLAKNIGGRDDVQVLILSGDLDCLQMVKKNKVIALVPKTGISNMVRYDEDAVERRYGVLPKKLPEYKGLVGDTSDNIPGVPGIGPKNAVDIIKRFGNIENACAKLETKLNLSKAERALVENKKTALLSKSLAIIKTDVPINVSFDKMAWKEINNEKLKSLLSALGFKTILKRVGLLDETDGYNEKPVGQRGLF